MEQSKLFTCAECGERFTINEFTDFQVCKACYDKYWEEYCMWLDSQAEMDQMSYDEELQIEGI